MKIEKKQITRLASKGYITLQIPTLDLIISESNYIPSPKKLIDFPDEWFWKLTTSYKFTKRNNYLLFLSEEGWKYYKQKIKTAFKKSKYKRGTWEDFEKHAQKFFDKIKKKNAPKLCQHCGGVL